MVGQNDTQKSQTDKVQSEGQTQKLNLLSTWEYLGRQRDNVTFVFEKNENFKQNSFLHKQATTTVCCQLFVSSFYEYSSQTLERVSTSNANSLASSQIDDIQKIKHVFGIKYSVYSRRIISSKKIQSQFTIIAIKKVIDRQPTPKFYRNQDFLLFFCSLSEHRGWSFTILNSQSTNTILLPKLIFYIH